jgi:DNA-binding LacI/PurR family transcriptional regulator
VKSTIYDVAQRAGVSISTVSLAMNSPDRVSAPARAKVLAAIDDLGYVPKSDAVSRARRGIGRVGVVAPFSSYPSSAERLNGVFDELARSGSTAEVVAIDHESAAVTDSPLLESLPLTTSLDGLIVVGITPSADAVDRFRRQDLPVVIVGVDEYLDLPTVSIAEGGGARLVAELLHARGYERYLYLGEHQESLAYTSQSQLRGLGFRERLRELGVPDARIDERTSINDLDRSRGAVDEFLRGADETLGVFAYCDIMAAGALQALRRAGREVPREAGVAGFDDGEIARAVGLSTVRQPLRESGRVAMHQLLEAIEGREVTAANIRLAIRLIERDT